jgi:uncharacterized protein (DUF305 family)
MVAVMVISALPWVTAACQSSGSATDAQPTTPAPTAPVLQPGRPGDPNVTMTGTPVPPPARPAADPDDSRFMQDMISHHAQALRIVSVVAGQLTDPKVKAIASRIEAAQRPEIDAMARWLTAQGQRAPLEATHPLMTPGPDHRAMPGMASAQQLEALAQARGLAADRIFLTVMITHHEGALMMALEQRKNGTDDRATELSDDIYVTQSAEIRHLRQMLARLGTRS